MAGELLQPRNIKGNMQNVFETLLHGQKNRPNANNGGYVEGLERRAERLEEEGNREILEESKCRNKEKNMNETLKKIAKELTQLLKAEQQDSGFGCNLADHNYEQGMKDAISIVQYYIEENFRNGGNMPSLR